MQLCFFLSRARAVPSPTLALFALLIRRVEACISLRRLHNPLPPLQALHAISGPCLPPSSFCKGRSRAATFFPGSNPGQVFALMNIRAPQSASFSRHCSDWSGSSVQSACTLGPPLLGSKCRQQRHNNPGCCFSQLMICRVSHEMKSRNEAWPAQIRICEADTRNEARRRRVLGPVAHAACHSSSGRPVPYSVSSVCTV